MDEHVRWVTKADAAEELEISLSTLDRKIRNGEVEVRREGRRVFVRMAGEYITDEELLRRAIAREHELERTVRELEQSVSELNLRASELERERDEARESAATARRPYLELEMEHRREVAAHKATKGVLNVVHVIGPGAARAVDRQRSPVVVCAEVEEVLPARHPGLRLRLRET